MSKQISYVSSAGTGAVCFDALDALPEPDAPTWLECRYSGDAHVSKARASTGVGVAFVPGCEADEIAHAIMQNGAARYGFLAADVLGCLVDVEDTNGAYVVVDCFHDDHNAAGRRQMFARNGKPGTHGAAYGCRDDNCTDHNEGDPVELRLTRLLSSALQAGVISLDDLPDFFADELAKRAVIQVLSEREGENARVRGDANEPEPIDWSQDQRSKELARQRALRASRRVRSAV